MDSILSFLWNHAHTTKKIGDEIEFGSFPRNDAESPQPIKWTVLDVQKDKCLIITNECIIGKNYHNSAGNIDWEHSSLRQWLNLDFIRTAFSSEEQSKIIETEISNEDLNALFNQFTTLPSTRDKVFILSCREAATYYSTNEARQSKTSKYAAATGADFDFIEGRGRWWLRTSNKSTSSAYCVLFKGAVSGFPYSINDGDGCVRPVMWVKM